MEDKINDYMLEQGIAMNEKLETSIDSYDKSTKLHHGKYVSMENEGDDFSVTTFGVLPDGTREIFSIY